jgi:hypothetical protein
VETQAIERRISGGHHLRLGLGVGLNVNAVMNVRFEVSANVTWDIIPTTFWDGTPYS